MQSRHESINQSINQFIYVNTWDGVAPIIQARAESGPQASDYSQILRKINIFFFIWKPTSSSFHYFSLNKIL